MIRNILLAGVALAVVSGPAVAQTTPTPAPAATPAVERRTSGTLTMENVPVGSQQLRDELRRYQNARNAVFQDWLEDGSILVSTRFGQTTQIHRVAAPGADRAQLTFFDEPIGGATARPGTNTFLFSRDTGGDEYFQGYLAGLSGPEKALTQPGTRNQSFVFSKDGSRLAWAEIGKGDPNYRIVTATLDADGVATPLAAKWQGAGSTAPVAFSPDGKTLLLQQYISSTLSRLYIMDVATSKVTPLHPTKKDVAYDGGAFTADGKSVLVLSDETGEFKRLVEIEIATGKVTPITAADLKWDVEAFDLSFDGRLLAYSINEGGRSKVVIQDFRTRRALPQPTLPVGVLTALDFNKDGTRLAIGLNASTSPADVWSWDVEGATLTRWTTSETGGLDPAALVEPTLETFKSFDGLEVPAWVYRPKTATGKSPVYIDIHGGPEGQARPGFNSRHQYLVNELGVTVIVPNVRGSDGYGKTYLQLDNGPRRQDSVKDIGALLDWVAAQPDLDKDRVVVAGGSYGGFMTLASLAAYSDSLAGAIDVVGISHFGTFLANTEGYRRDNRRAEYGDERDPKMKAIFDQISPLNLTAGMKKPLFVIQGRNDPRVPWTEAEQIVAKVRGQGGDVWYMIAADEGHGFRKKQNVDAQREAETLFLRKVYGLD
jgi:dipeptidyl aminopeptidase/acylaminoacyl peptidase